MDYTISDNVLYINKINKGDILKHSKKRLLILSKLCDCDNIAYQLHNYITILLKTGEIWSVQTDVKGFKIYPVVYDNDDLKNIDRVKFNIYLYYKYKYNFLKKYEPNIVLSPHIVERIRILLNTIKNISDKDEKWSLIVEIYLLKRLIINCIHSKTLTREEAEDELSKKLGI